MLGADCNISSCTDSSDEDDCRRKIVCVHNDKPIIARPNARAGYWLACLLPLALGVNYLQKTNSQCKKSQSHDFMFVAAIGMCIESLCFFMYLFLDTGLILKVFISLVPGVWTSCLLIFTLQQSVYFGIFWGFAVTFCYQNAYIRVMRGFPRCFSYGEAAVLVQGLMLFVFNMLQKCKSFASIYNSVLIDGKGFIATQLEFETINTIIMSAMFFLLVACWLLIKLSFLRKPLGFYALMVLLFFAVTCAPVMKPLPVVSLFLFLTKDQTRLQMFAYWAFLVVVSVLFVTYQLGNAQHASTRMRKVFHLLVILVYVPGVLKQCLFLYLASAVALAIFTLLELLRLLRMPPFSSGLQNAFAKFSDEKDAGMLSLTPFCLLIGCSIPLWITPCPCAFTAVDNEVQFTKLFLSTLSGVWTIGFGDTAASVVGSKFGRLNWPNSRRTVEGTMAFIVAVLAAIGFFNICGVISMSAACWFATVVATFASAVIEARTDQVDNLVLPLVFYIIVNLT